VKPRALGSRGKPGYKILVYGKRKEVGRKGVGTSRTITWFGKGKPVFRYYKES